MTKILIACSPHKVSLKAAENYFENLDTADCYVKVFHLHTPPQIHVNIGGAQEQRDADAIYEDKEEQMEEKLRNLQHKYNVPEDMFEYVCVDTSNHSNKADNIAGEILHEAEKWKADKIVMGCRKSMEKKFLGSVSDIVGQKAKFFEHPCQVIVLKEN